MKRTIVAVSPDSPIMMFLNRITHSSSIEVLSCESFNQIEMITDHRCMGVLVCQKNITLRDLSIWHRLREKSAFPFVFITPGNNEQLEYEILNQLFSISAQPDVKKTGPEREVIYLSPDVIFDPSCKMIWKQGGGQMLTLMEYRLLEYLLESGDWVINIDHIINKVWGVDTFTSSNTVYVHIRKLREKIEEDPSNPKILVTCHGLGYRLNIMNNMLEVDHNERTVQLK
ncbi:winged helix-turn-helix domain-containing protein [Paenibacillus sp. FSL W8-0919]|uniref:winged helix-turn-helix domain-containing protein n=1 Tax=Paenibacillus sp. FSL W8-0919 TaxID=2954707 RepID=UPI0030F7E5D7